MNATAEAHGTHHLKPADAQFGMWLFLLTEVMFFGALFVLYSVYRFRFAGDFARGSAMLDTFVGAENTIILLSSSLTVVLSIEYLREMRRLPAFLLILCTIACGAIFLFNKYHEWMAKIGHGIFPGSGTLSGGAHGETVFFGLYFFMTGLHALHVLIGMILFVIALGLLLRQGATERNHLLLENSGLYWHLVDVIWVFLFPFFYLI